MNYFPVSQLDALWNFALAGSAVEVRVSSLGLGGYFAIATFADGAQFVVGGVAFVR